MQAEYDSLLDNNTWTFVDEPEDQQVLSGKWVYKVKYGASGQVDKFKARCVGKGYAQIEGVDFFDTCSNMQARNFSNSTSNCSTKRLTPWSNGRKISPPAFLI